MRDGSRSELFASYYFRKCHINMFSYLWKYRTYKKLEFLSGAKGGDFLTFFIHELDGISREMIRDKIIDSIEIDNMILKVFKSEKTIFSPYQCFL